MTANMAALTCSSSAFENSLCVTKIGPAIPIYIKTSSTRCVFFNIAYGISGMHSNLFNIYVFIHFMCFIHFFFFLMTCGF